MSTGGHHPLRRPVDEDGNIKGAPALRRRDDAAARRPPALHRRLAPSSSSPRPSKSLPDLPADVIVTRDEQQGRGPLEGLRAGLKALPGTIESAYVTSCDVPLLVPGFVRRMIELLADHDIAVMEIDGFPHPLSAVYRRSTLPHVEALLAQNRLRPVFLFDAVRTRRVQPAEMLSADPELLTLRNLNTREDYLEALAIAGLLAQSHGCGPAGLPDTLYQPRWR